MPDTRQSISAGIHFGMTSGVITTLGLMVGLHSGTHSIQAVIGGVITIAIADAFSDALGIHISEESRRDVSASQVWWATVATFAAKLLMALTFVLPVLLWPLDLAVTISVAWGMTVLAWLSYRMARARGERPWSVMIEHLLIAALVIVISQQVGGWVARYFGA